MKADASVQAEVEKKSFLESQPIDESFQVYFRTLPYYHDGGLILAVTTVMMVFNKPDLRMRNLCAPVKLRHVNLQLAYTTYAWAGWHGWCCAPWRSCFTATVSRERMSGWSC
mgnify:FL=1